MAERSMVAMSEPERAEYVRASVEYSRRETAAWRKRATLDFAHLRGDIPNPFEQDDLAAVIPPTLAIRCKNARNLLFPSNEGIEIYVDPTLQNDEDEPNPTAEKRARDMQEILEATYRAANDWVDYQLEPTTGLHAICGGMGAIYQGYNPTLKPPKPKGPDARKSSEAYQQWQQLNSRTFPYEIRAKNPLHVYPDPSSQGRDWCAEMFKVKAGWLSTRWGIVPPEVDVRNPSWRETDVEWVDFRTKDYAYRGTLSLEFPQPSGPHYHGHTGWTIFEGGFGVEDMRWEDKFIGLCTLPRELGLLRDESVFLSVISVMASLNAFPATVMDVSLDGISWKPGAFSKRDFAQFGKPIQELLYTYTLPQVPPALFQHLKVLKDYIDLATVSSMLGSGETPAGGVAATAMAALRQAATPIVPLRRTLEKQLARSVLTKLAQDLRNPKFFGKDDQYSLSLQREGGQKRVRFNRDKILAYPDIRVVIDPQSELDKQSRIATGKELAGELSRETRMAKYYGISNPTQELNRLSAEKLLETRLQNPHSALNTYLDALESGALAPGQTLADFKRQQAQQQALAGGPPGPGGAPGAPPGVGPGPGGPPMPGGPMPPGGPTPMLQPPIPGVHPGAAMPASVDPRVAFMQAMQQQQQAVNPMQQAPQLAVAGPQVR